MSQIIKGQELMVFLDGKSLAFATGHTLTITGNSVDVASKDHGFWGASEIASMSWEIQSENLFTDTAYDDLFEAMISRQAIDLVFGHSAESDDVRRDGIVNDETHANWTPDKTGHKYYEGKAYITSLTLNAANGDNSTMSVTFSGAGAIKQMPAA